MSTFLASIPENDGELVRSLVLSNTVRPRPRSLSRTRLRPSSLGGGVLEPSRDCGSPHLTKINENIGEQNRVGEKEDRGRVRYRRGREEEPLSSVLVEKPRSVSAGGRVEKTTFLTPLKPGNQLPPCTLATVRVTDTAVKKQVTFIRKQDEEEKEKSVVQLPSYQDYVNRLQKQQQPNRKVEAPSYCFPIRPHSVTQTSKEYNESLNQTSSEIRRETRKCLSEILNEVPPPPPLSEGVPTSAEEGELVVDNKLTTQQHCRNAEGLVCLTNDSDELKRAEPKEFVDNNKKKPSGLHTSLSNSPLLCRRTYLSPLVSLTPPESKSSPPPLELATNYITPQLTLDKSKYYKELLTPALLLSTTWKPTLSKESEKRVVIL